jgi:hypothetical protein
MTALFASLRRHTPLSLCSHVALVLLTACVPVLAAATCGVAKHNPPTEADKAFLAADYAKAEMLYKAGLDTHPGDVDATVGLVHVLLREQKVIDAEEAVRTAMEASANSASFLTLRGEVELRQGEPWAAEPTVIASYKLDPCNARTRLLYARIAEVNSRYATARQQIGFAYKFDPADPEIRAAWIQTLPLAQRITEMEAYLVAPSGDDAGTIGQMKANLEIWKKESAAAPHACRMVSTAAPADIPFIKLLGYAGHTRAAGLEVILNNTPTRLQVGSDDGGITLNRSMAERAGLKKITEPEKGPGGKSSIAFADTLKVGNLEFQNCKINVTDTASGADDTDGTIGVDVFSDFLITLDYPMRKLQLAPLPVKPGDPAFTPSLKTSSIDALENLADLGDRVISPEAKDFTQVYRAGDSIILPAALNGQKVKLFVMDFLLDPFGSQTNIAAGVAMDVTKVHEKEVGGPGPSRKIFIADEITYNFAHMSQKVNGVVTTDTSGISKTNGMDIAGSIGLNTYSLLVMHIDYRDGLMKFDYIPNRGYASW